MVLGDRLHPRCPGEGVPAHGPPGRGEIDDTQEINYKPIMEEIAKTGYTGYVGQEFIPRRDPLKSLKEAVALCDV